MFPILDYYMGKNDFDIKTEYDEIIRKSSRCVDFDNRLMVIVNYFVNNKDKFTDYEVKILSLLLKIRKDGGMISFHHFYPIMKNEVFNYKSINREDDIEIIMFIYDRSGCPAPPEVVNIESMIVEGPQFTYESICSYGSPPCDQKYSTSDNLNEIPLCISSPPTYFSSVFSGFEV